MKSPGLAVIIADKLKAKKGMGSSRDAAPEDDEEDDSMGSGRRAAASKIIDAVKAGDADALDKALGRFVEMCSADGYDDSDDEE